MSSFPEILRGFAANADGLSTALWDAARHLEQVERELAALVAAEPAHAATSVAAIAAVTSIHENSAHDAMRALVAHALPTLKGKWRHHGIGMLQAYLQEDVNPEIRVHIWSPLLVKPGIDESGDIHDHRFDMISHVLHGTIAHEVYFPTQRGYGWSMLELTHARAASGTKYHGPTTPLDGMFGTDRQLYYIHAGQSYTFKAQQFHRSPIVCDLAITVVEKHNQNNELPARLLYPTAKPPVMAFGHDIDTTLVDSLVERACAALVQKG